MIKGDFLFLICNNDTKNIYYNYAWLVVIFYGDEIQSIDTKYTKIVLKVFIFSSFTQWVVRNLQCWIPFVILREKKCGPTIQNKLKESNIIPQLNRVYLLIIQSPKKVQPTQRGSDSAHPRDPDSQLCNTK